MSILLVGLNHRTAPVELRELLTAGEDSLSEGLRCLLEGGVCREALIVSTCNRVEVLAETRSQGDLEGANHIRAMLSQLRSVPQDHFESHLYQHVDDAAVRHIFRVAASLDSLVVGEAQILGQVRKAYSAAVEAGTAGRVLNRLIHHAFRVAKRVRTETGIAANAVSISFMAVELGRKVFGNLNRRTVLVVGAGEMAELAVKHLVNAGAAQVLVTNRTAAAAQELAESVGGATIPFDELDRRLGEADIVICSTGAPDYVITAAMARTALTGRRQNPTCFVDISVPRNVDPAVAELPNVFVFDIDDLEAVIASNIREREREAHLAELIVESEVMQFQQALRLLDIGPALGGVRKRMQDIARDEMLRQRNQLGELSPAQEQAVEKILLAAVNKISHPLMQSLRSAHETGDVTDVAAWCEQFMRREDEETH
jgi:glutamyl-tRNA reductase